MSAKVVDLVGQPIDEGQPHLNVLDVLRWAIERNKSGEFDTLALVMVSKGGEVVTGWHYEDDKGLHIPIGAVAMLQHELMNDQCES